MSSSKVDKQGSSSNNLMVDLNELKAKISNQMKKANETPQQIKIGKYTIEEIDGKLMISDGKEGEARGSEGSFKFSVNEMYEVLINHCEALKTLINK